ncbi:tumor necrosis factor receptor superfamily member 11B-like isoform X1 [Argopecten irradians]|uniref:tumor necrosis factor receptor superfamily member 11B-like isoform X1 n=1 Tax=Argopecten irradians TaxID=31199 RepID=UPI00371463BA
MALAKYTCVIYVTIVQISTAKPIYLVPHLLSGKPVNCIPVECRKGFQLSFCKRNRTTDYCHLCPPGSKQDQAVYSGMVRSEEDIPKCQRIDTTCLMPETISIVENGRVHCVCDISRGYIGDDAFCIRMGSCSPGMELTKTSGRCMPCPQGTYKATEDYTFCQPHTSCDANGRETVEEGNAISDTVCGRYLQTTKQLKSVHLTPTTVVMTTLPDFTGKTDPMILKQVEPSSTHLVATQSDPEYSLSLLYVLVILVIVLQLLSFERIVHRRNGRCFKRLGRPSPRDNDVNMTTITHEIVSSTDDIVRINHKEKAG